VKYDKPMRFRDFINQYGKASHRKKEQKKLVEGFLIGLAMFGFLYALLTAPDSFLQSYVPPHASQILFLGFLYSLGVGLRFEYLEWRKRAK
jgi:hypothetical protein